MCGLLGASPPPHPHGHFQVFPLQIAGSRSVHRKFRTHSSKPGQRPKSSQGCELTQKPRASRLQEPAAGKYHPEQKSQRNRKIFFLLPSTAGSVAGGWAESQGKAGKGKAGLQCLSQLFPAKASPPAPGKLLPSTDARAAGTGINRRDGNNLAAHELHTPRSLEREVESPL